MAELLAHQHHSPGTSSGSCSGTSNLGKEKEYRDYFYRRRNYGVEFQACYLPVTTHRSQADGDQSQTDHLKPIEQRDSTLKAIPVITPMKN